MIVFVTLLPLFLKWSKNTTVLGVDDVRLRNKDGVELVPISGTPDVDAIASKYFVPKGKSKVVQFVGKGRTEVSLELQYDKYNEVLTNLDALEEQEMDRELASPSTDGICHCVYLRTYF
jgi:hypothetical protein